MAPAAGTTATPGQALPVPPIRRQPSEEIALLHQAVRRLCAALIEGEWIPVLVDAASRFAPRAAVFSVRGNQTILELDSRGATLTSPVELSLAPALLSASGGSDPVIALRTAGELSEKVIAAFADGSSRVHLYPLRGARKTNAILYAEGESGEVEGDALELLASVVTLAWQSRGAAADDPAGTDSIANRLSEPIPASDEELVRIAPEPAESGRSIRSRGAPEGDWELHLRAERFARARVAEMMLYKPQQVKEGRASNDLYSALREDIDRGRELFRAQFVKSCPSMADYFHEELVRTLANYDANLLGERYPGPLV
jgi:hypothetical protein